MTNQTISNFFIPIVSKEIMIKLQPLELDRDNSCEEEEKEYSTSPDVHYGLLDGSKQNDSYKELIELIGITNITNQEIMLTIENNLINAFETIKKDPVEFSSINGKLTWMLKLIQILIPSLSMWYFYGEGIATR